jgi:hypothetical protein
MFLTGTGMMIENIISIENSLEWKKALKGIKHAFAHTWENCYAMYLTTGFPTYLYTFELENVRIVCPISERTFAGYTDIITPYGFSGFVGNDHCLEFPSYWDSFVKTNGYICGYIGLNPLFEDSSYYRTDEIYQYNNVYVLDLSLTSSELFQKLSRNRKRELKHWEDSFVKITSDKEVLTEFFISHYHNFFRSRSASKAYDFSIETLSFMANLENVFIVGVQTGGKIEAVSVFAYTQDVGEGLFNVFIDQGRRYSSLLTWYGVIYLKSMGIPYLNLGGGVREGDGIAESKQYYGAKQLPLKCLKQVYEPCVYEKLCLQINGDPNDRVGYFPPYQKP